MKKKILITDRMWKWLDECRPGAAAMLRTRGIREVEVEFGGTRTRLRFDGLKLPARRHSTRGWEDFDRQVDSDDACLVVDGTLEDQYSRCVHRGRIPKTAVETGDRIWIDPKMYHHPPVCDMGPHAAERETRVTANCEEGFKVELTFDDGWKIVWDVDDIAWSNRAWVETGLK